VVRAGRLTETRPEHAEQGYLLLPEAERQHGELPAYVEIMLVART